jgi:DNA-binding response OmpR family regulator
MILVADDDKKLVNTICEALRTLHFTPDPSFSAKGTIYKIRKTKYDLAILDWFFENEKLNGYDLINTITNHQKNLPILMLTGRGSLASCVESFSFGADDYLKKPFHMSELLARVNALLRRGQSDKKRNIKIVVGPLMIDSDECKIYLNNKIVNLNHKEFQIIKLFVENRERVVTRAELIKKIWINNNGQILSNTVDVHIRRLREQLAPIAKSIKTIHGIGYRFDEKEINLKI